MPSGSGSPCSALPSGGGGGGSQSARVTLTVDINQGMVLDSCHPGSVTAPWCQIPSNEHRRREIASPSITLRRRRRRVQRDVRLMAGDLDGRYVNLHYFIRAALRQRGRSAAYGPVTGL